MARALSLRSRLVAGTAIVAVVLIAVCVALTVTIRGQLISQVDDRLRSLAPGGPGRGQAPPPWLEDLAANPPATPTDPFAQRISDVYQGFINTDGQLVTLFAPNFADGQYPTPAVDPTSLDVDQPITFTVDASDGTTTYRVLVQPAGDLISVTGLPISAPKMLVGSSRIGSENLSLVSGFSSARPRRSPEIWSAAPPRMSARESGTPSRRSDSAPSRFAARASRYELAAA